MASIISTITSIVTAAVGWVTSFLGMITTQGNEILLLAVLMPFVGLGIGLLKRLLSTRA